MVQSSRLGEHDTAPIALATLGVSGHNKSLCMASLGIFGASNPIPPGPGIHAISPRHMLINVGHLM